MQLLLSAVCLALTSAVVGSAYYQKKQFYPAVVHITKSNASMAVIYVQFFVIVFMFGKLLRKIFLGTLRAAEFEHLLERFWYALTETCLAFTVFRDDFNPRFVALFTVLLFLKSFHWLAEERVDYMERSPVLGWLFHIRVASLLLVLGSVDYALLMHAYNSTVVRGPTVQLVFGFEYAILLTMVASTTIKYVLHAAEMRTDTPWENKAVFLLYTELVIGLMKVILYVLFVVIMAKIYALPMFVFRPMFFTIRNFKKALSDVIMSRRAIRNMNTLYPDATTEELQLSDNICIICREDMVNHAKKLPCGHIFHTTCLRSWFQRQQTCPTCRLNILRAPAVNSTALPRAEEVPAAAVAAAVAGVAPNVAQDNANAATLAPPIGNADLPRADIGATTFGASVAGLSNTAIPNAVTFQGMPMVPPPFMMPPPFSFIAPYAVPPPPMPPDLTNLSDEELRAMEGNERRNVEERIKLLKNIQLMLDAASILMHDYQLVAARSQQQQQQQQQAAEKSSKEPSAATNAADDQPSTSAAAAAAAFSAYNHTTPTIVSTGELQTTATTNNTTTAATAVHNSRSNNVLRSAATTTTATPLASTFKPTSLTKTNDVTIEDLGVEEEEASSVKRDLSTTTLLEGGTHHVAAENGDDNELSELRKRRLKFLEERNKSTTATD